MGADGDRSVVAICGSVGYHRDCLSVHDPNSEVSLKCKSECECDKVGEVITGYWCLLMCVWVWVILPQHHNTIPLFHHQCYCGNCGVVSWNSAYLPLPSKTTLPAMADTSNNACTWQLHI